MGRNGEWRQGERWRGEDNGRCWERKQRCVCFEGCGRGDGGRYGDSRTTCVVPVMRWGACVRARSVATQVQAKVNRSSRSSRSHHARARPQPAGGRPGIRSGGGKLKVEALGMESPPVLAHGPRTPGAGTLRHARYSMATHSVIPRQSIAPPCSDPANLAPVVPTRCPLLPAPACLITASFHENADPLSLAPARQAQPPIRAIQSRPLDAVHGHLRAT